MAAVAGCAAADEAPTAGRLALERGVVAFVSDGDTLRLADGRRVRLLQLDAPEPLVECFGLRAAETLRQLAAPGAAVRLEAEPRLGNRDRFGRLLRYVHAGKRHVNLALVARGAAAPYFFGRRRGRYAGALLDAAERARDERRGLWGRCPGARLEPDRVIDAGPP